MILTNDNPQFHTFCSVRVKSKNNRIIKMLHVKMIQKKTGPSEETRVRSPCTPIQVSTVISWNHQTVREGKGQKSSVLSLIHMPSSLIMHLIDTISGNKRFLFTLLSYILIQFCHQVSEVSRKPCLACYRYFKLYKHIIVIRFRRVVMNELRHTFSMPYKSPNQGREQIHKNKSEVPSALHKVLVNGRNASMHGHTLIEQSLEFSVISFSDTFEAMTKQEDMQ